jgi:BMFP domain-containing protein YqiC
MVAFPGPLFVRIAHVQDEADVGEDEALGDVLLPKTRARLPVPGEEREEFVEDPPELLGTREWSHNPTLAADAKEAKMVEPLFSQLRSRGEEFLTEVSNKLMANPAFIEVLKKGVAAKEEVDKRVADALKTMNVATRREVGRLEHRIAALEAELAELKAKAAPKAARKKK